MNRDDSKLVLRDIPIFIWILGLIFAVVGVVIVLDSSGRAPFMGLVFIAIGLGLLLFVSVLTVTADRITRTLKLEYRSILLRSSKEVPFDEIAGINVERSLSHSRGRSSYTYHVVLKRRDGQLIPFRSSSSSGSRKKEQMANQLREFIGVQGFDSRPDWVIALDSQSAEPRETEGIHWQVRPITAGGGVRWHSPDFQTPGFFLFLAQKAEGQASRGFLASLGSMFFRQSLSLYGFQADDTPGIDQASNLAPLDPAIESHFMAFTNAPAPAGQILNSKTVSSIAQWAGRYPLRQFHKGGGQLVVLFSPNGVYLANMNLQPTQVDELSTLGLDLIRSQSGNRSLQGA